jgi:hypothetical protein
MEPDSDLRVSGQNRSQQADCMEGLYPSFPHRAFVSEEGPAALLYFILAIDWKTLCAAADLIESSLLVLCSFLA